MIVDKDNPMKSLRWFNKEAADKAKRDLNYLKRPGVKYFFDKEKTIQDELLEIKPLGNNDQYHLICVSRRLVEVPIVEFTHWNNITFDTEKYLS